MVPGTCILTYPDRPHWPQVRTSAGSPASRRPPGAKRTGFWDFRPVSVKNRKRAQPHSRPIEAQNEKPLVVCLPSSRHGLGLWRTLLVLRCHASGVVDTIGAIGEAVPAVPTDLVDHCLDRLPTLLSWPDLPVTPHRLAGGVSLPSLSA